MSPQTGVVAALCAFALGCDPPPPAAEEWTPADHDRIDESRRARSGEQTPAGKKDDGSTLVEITWAQSCAVCHGPAGHGDGPRGAMLKVPDLTRAEWQARVTDSEIEERIRTGKGTMPRFDLPQAVAKGLVARIRAYRGTGAAPAQPAAARSSAARATAAEAGP